VTVPQSLHYEVHSITEMQKFKRSFSFTTILDFKLKYPENLENEWVIKLTHGDAEILLASMDGTPRVAIYVSVDDVDASFENYVRRGLIGISFNLCRLSRTLDS